MATGEKKYSALDETTSYNSTDFLLVDQTPYTGNSVKRIKRSTLFLDKGTYVYDVRTYGATGDGVTDDLAAINAAIVDATPTAGVVFFPPGTYAISGTITVSPPGTATVNSKAPSLWANSVPGRIGDDAPNNDQVMFVPTSSFVTGSFMLDYVPLNNNFSLNGFFVKGLGFKCLSKGAGVRICNTRRAHVSDVAIDNAAIPTNTNAAGSFNVTQLNGTACAYNYFENITTMGGAQDGFYHNTAGNDTFVNCFDLNSIRYAFSAQNAARWYSCHFETSQYGWNVGGGTNTNVIIGCDFFGRATISAVRITGGGAGRIPVEFIGCFLANQPSGTPTEKLGSVITIAGSGVVMANFIGCHIQGQANTTDFVYIENNTTGGKVQFSNCNFDGAVTTKLFNDLSGANVVQFHDCVGIADTPVNNARTIVADASYAALMSDNIIAYTSLSTGRTVTLPDATYYTGELTIKDETGSASTRNITLATSLSQTIDGASTKVINTNYGYLKVYSNGTNWFTVV